MKNLLFFLFSLFTLSITAQNESTPSSKITEVTVFMNGAQITRTSNVSLKSGQNKVTISGLTQHVNSQSINVKGNSNYLIKSVNHQSDFLSDTEKNGEIASLEKELEDIKFRIETRSSLERVYQEEKNLLLANKSIKGANESLLAEDLKEMAVFFRAHMEELEYKLLEIREEKKDLEKKRKELRLELNKSRGSLNNYSSKVELVLESKKSQNVSLEFSYIVYNAGWYATYDVRTTEIDKPVQLIYKANISQTTGNDWDDIDISLSTGNPMVNGTKPVLNPWYISVYNPQDTYGRYKNNKQLRQQADEGTNEPSITTWGDAPLEDDLSYNIELGNTSLLTQSVEALTSTEFEISIPYTIPSDGESYEVEIQRNDLQSSFSYYTAPAIEKDAFLLSRLTKWSELNLLPGEANVFYQGSFVGSSFLDPYSSEDTLDISLGKDKNIIVSREKIEEYCKTNSFGGNKKTSRAYKITVKNNKSTTIHLKLEDQIPVSQQNDVSVSVENISNGELNEQTGIVTWKVPLAPGESKEFLLQFEVKYPKKLKLADSNSSLKLYAVLLGGMAEGCNIELHDVQFTVSDKIENAYFDLLDKWFGIKEKMHVDSYIILDIIDGYEVSLRSEKSSQKEKLFFINLGAYQEGKFSELHEIKFVVDSSKISVKKRAKASMLQGKTSVHTDDLFEVDDCITISEINGWYIHLTPTHKEEKLTPVNGYMPLPKKTVREYLIRNQTQLFDTN